MKLIKKNIELIMVLIIMFILFVTLVVFYENKLETTCMCDKLASQTYKVEDNKVEFTFTVLEKITDDYIKISDEYNNIIVINYNNISNKVKEDKTYKASISKAVCDKYNYKNIQTLINTSKLSLKEVK